MVFHYYLTQVALGSTSDSPVYLLTTIPPILNTIKPTPGQKTISPTPNPSAKTSPSILKKVNTTVPSFISILTQMASMIAISMMYTINLKKPERMSSYRIRVSWRQQVRKADMRSRLTSVRRRVFEYPYIFIWLLFFYRGEMDRTARLLKIQQIAKSFRQANPNIVGQKVKIVEVGPRDGLQNQKQIISLTQKMNLINRLSKAHLPVVEVGSFVSPKWIPQMANSKELYQQIQKIPGVGYPCLVPNSKGMETALEIGVKEIAIFASATEGFSKKNLNCSIAESIDRFMPVMKSARENNVKVRGYVSMVMGCPFDGEVQPEKVRWVVQKLLEIGCYEVSLGDTVGRGTVQKTKLLFQGLKGIAPQLLAAHFHDTFDTAIQNILTAVSYGCRTVDSSVGGLGGCPYSMKPVGNVCTENVVYALEEAGLTTGVDIQKVAEIGAEICGTLSRPSLSVV